MDFIQQNLPLFVVAVLSGAMLVYVSFSRPRSKRGVTPAQATLLINRENAHVIDVSEPDEFAGGHLPDSRNIPLSRFDERAGELDKLKERALILVCQTGARTPGVVKRLEKLGFTRLHSLDGGLKAWTEAGLPLKRGARK